MKRLPEILFFALISAILTAAVPAPERIVSVNAVTTIPAVKDDTTGLIRLLKVDTFNLAIIPPSSGVQFYKDRIVFLSSSKNEMKMSPNQISFGAVEAYTAYVKDSILGRHTVFSPTSLFSYPCEAMTFSHDCNTIYFTMIPKKSNKEKIYKAKFTANSKNEPELVTEPNPLDFCSDNANYSHPALSSDENMMIFASDMAGSIGGMDLYVTKKTGEKWSAPLNLGKMINTTGNEFYPFLDSENNLYFSSDKLPGFGGWDIFTCKYNGTDWDKPLNLSERINSEKDDIAFTISKTDGKTAFFTRRQEPGKADVLLFRIKLKKEIAESDPLTISTVFNGTPVSKQNLAVTQSENVKPAVPEELKTIPEKQAVTEPAKPLPGKQVVSEPVKAKPVKEAVKKPEQEVRPAENKPVTITTTKPIQSDQKDVVVYKVQLLPNKSQINAKKIDINGTTYKIGEYLYLGAIRYTIGEFSSLGQATALQRMSRQSGYPQSFVVAFKNNSRSLDKSLFK